MQFDSKEELYFSWWCEELEQAGYIDSWNQCKSYELGEKIINRYVEKLKSKSKEKEQTILSGSEYTPDFEINWNPSAFELFYHEFPYLGADYKINTNLLLAKFERHNETCCKSIIEIKPSFDKNNMTRLNQLNRRWMYQKHSIFVNLIKVPDIFKDTFTPKKYLLTDTGKQQRIIHFPIVSLEQFVNISIKPVNLVKPELINLKLDF